MGLIKSHPEGIMGLENYQPNLLDLIREDRKNGLTYNEIMIKHNLKSNNLIKIAMGKTLGGDPKYNGRHTERFRRLCEIEKKYNKIVKSLEKILAEMEELKCLF